MITAPKTAIILHGPPTAGKTQVSREIQRRRRDEVCLISLDDGWLPGEIRHAGGPARYADLSDATAPILVVEIGCGEPPDLAFPGATQGAAEWVSLLHNSNRTVFPFLMWPEYSDVVTRIEQRNGQDPNSLFLLWQQVGVYMLYEHRHPLLTFPEIPNFREQRIGTSKRTVVEVTDEILRKSGF